MGNFNLQNILGNKRDPIASFMNRDNVYIFDLHQRKRTTIDLPIFINNNQYFLIEEIHSYKNESKQIKADSLNGYIKCIDFLPENSESPIQYYVNFCVDKSSTLRSKLEITLLQENSEELLDKETLEFLSKIIIKNINIL